MKHLVIIDGYGFVFRAFHSMPPLTRRDGVEVGTVYGFTNMIIRLLTETDATHFVVVFDSGGKNFRHELYPEYKAHRPPVPESLIEQFPIVRQAVKALNVVSLEQNGFEADDIIATLATKGYDENFKITIVSSDKDLMQLVNDRVIMYDPIKAKPITATEVIDKFGVEPSKVREVLALIGDASDNIPGVKGIGPKSAQELISQFKDLKGVYENINSLKASKRKDYLIEQQANAFLSYELVGLEKDVPLHISFDDLVVKKPEYEELLNFLERNQFKSIKNKIDHLLNGKNHKLTISTNHFNQPASALQLKHPSDLIGMYSNQRNLYIIPHQEDYIVGFDQVNFIITSPDKFTDLISLIANPGLMKIGFNIKALVKHTNLMPSHFTDLQTVSYLLDSSLNIQTVNDFLQHYLQVNDNITEPQEKINALIKLLPSLLSQLQQRQLISLLTEVEQPLIKITHQMEQEGIKIDCNYLKNLSQDLAEQLSQIEMEIFKITNVTFNIGSPKQLGEVLFNKMQIPAPKKTKTGWSTDAAVMEELSLQGHAIADKILHWREINKLITTYTDSLIVQADDISRIHTTYSLTSTITGRFSSSSPNLQNIPIRTEEGRKIRKAFIAKEGYSLVSADYSQIELRLLAHIAGIDSLKDAFHHNKDIHSTTASEVFGVDIENVSSELRRKAKAINFGIIYGISPFGLAKQLMIEKSEAKHIIDKYFETYPGIKQYMERMQQYAKDHGYIKTILNRRCYIKDINSGNFIARNFSERLAINAPLQGSAADIIKLAMIKIAGLLTKYDAKLLLQVHDELIVEANQTQATEIGETMAKLMSSVVELSVPLTVDVSIGNNWQDI
ncbi:DNA polymerase I [Rickettsiales endosymbiont of Stachyamoeba lipophora]|uniref:DNA polymerase I n=1 Tax=Rickettsiales endosymbiont of Stachyamoeba lipophora TaxID=2486578 RepID=UPI0013DDADFD|nr:DNA polymerase I [Rickettsiales endosymbiont of Stachyamoeba lipophora]